MSDLGLVLSAHSRVFGELGLVGHGMTLQNLRLEQRSLAPTHTHTLNHENVS